ncbi:MAG TPA: ornithine cyclodeaminase family protein, partial [Chloroflexota bacterium]|nr:ornithine cyclodeaminase family protein [Chloroflexota bacterium]
MLVLGRAELREIVTAELALRAAREAFAALANGGAKVPPRLHLSTPGGTSLFMPAFQEGSSAVALKAVTVTAANPARGLPTVQGLVLLFDETTGAPLALLEGTYLTAARTGAAIGLAADLLARPDAATVALFGA